LAKLTPLPSKNGMYVEIETVPDVFTQKGGEMPTSMLMVLGFLPATEKVDVETVRRTFHEVNKRSPLGPKRWVSWGMGQGAMTATRLQEPNTAVEILANDNKDGRFMKSGHVRRPKEPNGCVTYLPVNSAFLTAVGLMAGGWDAAPQTEAPGFPRDGNWVVKAEGLNRMP
jgi:hypothetical protein